jgi:hypothetical protein
MTKKMAAGGKASSFRDMTAGSGSGLGRLQKTSIAAKTKTQKLKVGGMVKGYADGGPMTMDEIIAANMKRNPGFKMAPGYEASARMGMEKQASDTSPERAAYNARQEKREAAAAAARKKANARKAMAVPSDANSRKRGYMGSVGTTMRSDPNSFNERLNDLALSESLKGVRSNSLNADAQDIESFVRGLPEGNPKEGEGRSLKRGGMARMAKGGKVKNFEGSFMDMVQDKKLAKKYGMSKKDYEKSPIDAKHDKQRNMKGLKMGGTTKMAEGGQSMAPGQRRQNLNNMTFDRLGMQAQNIMKAARPAPMAGAGPDGSSGRKPNQQMGGMKKGGMTKMAAGGMSTAQDGMKGALRPKPTGMAMGGYAKGGKTEMHDKGCKCMACGGMAKMAKGGKVTFGSMKPLPGTKTVGPTIRPTVETGASMKKDGMKGQLRAKASGAKPTNMMKPLGMTKMASGGKVRGTGIAQRGTKFIGEV